MRNQGYDSKCFHPPLQPQTQPQRPRGQCHRLRNEAAHAQYKEQEIGKQTRQALMENDALSRTVERLQKTFTTGKVSKRMRLRPLPQFIRPRTHSKTLSFTI